MECLVDDKMNSNLPSCPKCGLDTALTSNISRTTFVLCENCKSAISSAVVNNNPMPQTHRDFVPYPHFSRPRWCTCLEGTLTTTTATDSPATSRQGELLPMTRPRSSSSPLSTHSSPSYTLADQTASPSIRLSPPGLNVHPSLPVNLSISSHSPQSHSPADQCTDTSLDRLPLCSSSHSSPLPATDPEAETDSSRFRPRMYSDSGQCRLHNSSNLCQDCGGISPAWAGRPNINRLGHENSLPSLALNSPPSIVSSPPVQTSTTCSIVNESDQKRSAWSRRPREQLRASTSSRDGQTSSSSFTSSGPTADLSRLDGSGGNPQSTSFTSKTNSSLLHPTDPFRARSQIISHNMKHNQMTTGQLKTSPQGSGASSRSPRKDGGPMHLLTVPGQSGSRSLMRSRSRVVDMDTPLPLLPQELMQELHHLDHENEDLAADVVYSLHLRNYEIKEVLGKGISSTVRRVTEKTTGVEYAVKIIDISGEKGETAQVEQTKKDTFREIRILRMCAGHNNIIELHDVFETPTFIFLVFEICKKGELFDYLTSVVSLSEKRTRIFMRQLIEAVDSFHDKNIVHRDLKPENILLDDDLNIKVSDFGFATVIEPGEELTELCGTPGYLAPEVLAHSMYENVSGYGKEVDMWATGVIMYTLLCGAPPFWNRRQMMMLRAIMNADYTFNSPEWDDITDAPKNLIRKLLVVNPKERLTAKQALAHPFFHSQITEEKEFDARRKFRVGGFCVLFYLRLSYYYKHPPPISVDTVRSNPYSIKIMRKVIDTCAFGMYKHWVKRVDNQNRAALFEHTLRDDWKHNLMTVEGVKG